MATTDLKLLPVDVDLPATWPTLAAVVAARLPQGFFDHRPPRVQVVWAGGPRGGGEAARMWEDRYTAVQDELLAQGAAGVIRFIGRLGDPMASLTEIPVHLLHHARLKPAYGWVILPRVRPEPAVVWYDVRVLAAPSADVTASLPAAAQPEANTAASDDDVMQALTRYREVHPKAKYDEVEKAVVAETGRKREEVRTIRRVLRARLARLKASHGKI